MRDSVRWCREARQFERDAILKCGCTWTSDDRHSNEFAVHECAHGELVTLDGLVVAVPSDDACVCFVSLQRSQCDHCDSFSSRRRITSPATWLCAGEHALPRARNAALRYRPAIP